MGNKSSSCITRPQSFASSLLFVPITPCHSGPQEAKQQITLAHVTQVPAASPTVASLELSGLERVLRILQKPTLPHNTDGDIEAQGGMCLDHSGPPRPALVGSQEPTLWLL